METKQLIKLRQICFDCDGGRQMYFTEGFSLMSVIDENTLGLSLIMLN